MADTADKLYEINLDVPLTNVNGTRRQTFVGSVKVPKEVADDLLRRQDEYHAYERSLIRNNGSSINAGNLIGNVGE